MYVFVGTTSRPHDARCAGQRAIAHEVEIDLLCSLTTLVYCLQDEDATQLELENLTYLN